MSSLEISDFQKCECGAITVFTRDNKSYSLSEKNMEDFGINISNAKEIPESYCCNHCANHWGLDLCACGSGESPEECDGGFEECGKPMQNIV